MTEILKATVLSHRGWFDDSDTFEWGIFERDDVQAHHHAGITTIVEHLVEFPPIIQVIDLEVNPNVFHHWSFIQKNVIQ